MVEDRSPHSTRYELTSMVCETDINEVSETRSDLGSRYFKMVCDPDISLRPASAPDEPFLYASFASTRIDELAPTGWSEEQKDNFLRMQFEAQRRSYLADLPNAEYLVICCGTTAVGRLIVERTDAEIHIVDVAILTEFRKRGIGSVLMGRILREAEQTEKSVRLFVEKFNPVLGWYERLGFQVITTGPIYLEMIWRAESKYLSSSSPEVA